MEVDVSSNAFNVEVNNWTNGSAAKRNEAPVVFGLSEGHSHCIRRVHFLTLCLF